MCVILAMATEAIGTGIGGVIVGAIAAYVIGPLVNGWLKRRAFDELELVKELRAQIQGLNARVDQLESERDGERTAREKLQVEVAQLKSELEHAKKS